MTYPKNPAGRLLELRPEVDPVDYAPGDRFAFDLEILATSITLREDIETLYSLGHYDGPGSGPVPADCDEGLWFAVDLSWLIGQVLHPAAGLALEGRPDCDGGAL